MSRHLSPFFLLSFALLVGSCSAAWGIEVGEYVLESQPVISEWQRNYKYLGNPIENEHGVTSPTGQRGTKVRCMYGVVCMRYGSNAKAYSARGGIGQKYLSLGGPTGQLGFPLGNEFAFNAKGHDAQYFERGTIYWSDSAKQFVVGPPGRLPVSPTRPLPVGSLAPVKLNRAAK